MWDSARRGFQFQIEDDEEVEVEEEDDEDEDDDDEVFLGGASLEVERGLEERGSTGGRALPVEEERGRRCCWPSA